MKKWFVMMLALAAWGVANATVYYVSPSGSDAGSGTGQQPWRTIGMANATLEAGDTVFIMEGTYHEQINPMRSGQSGREIVYARYGSDNVVIDGIPTSLEVAILSTDYVVLDGLHIQAQAFLTMLNNHAYWVRVDGNHVTLRNCRIIAPGDPRVTYWQQRAYSRGIVIAGMYTTVEHCRVRGQMMGIVIAGPAPRYALLRYDSLYANGASNIVIIAPTDGGRELQGNLIEYCIIDTSFEEDNIQFEQNYDHNDQVYNRGTVIRYNRLGNATENCLDFKGAGDIIVEGNLLYGAVGDNDGSADGPDYLGNDDWGGVGIHRGANTVTDHVIIRENVVWDNHSGGVAFNRFHYYNNVFLNNRKSYRGSNSTNTDFEYVALEMWNCIDYERAVINNIIAGQPNAGVLAAKIYWGQKLTLDNNLYFDNAGPIAVRHDMGSGYETVKGLSAWQNILASQPGYAYLKGKEAHSIEADPQFLNAPIYAAGYDPAWNFMVSTTSPASGAGRCATTATNAGANSRTLAVDNALFFSDGFDAVAGDVIRVGDESAVRIAAIDYSSNVITLEESRTWAAGAGVHTYFSGSAPNIGLSGENKALPGQTGDPNEPPAAEAPGVPVIADISNGSTPVAVTAQIQWSPASLAEWYQIQIAMLPSFASTVVDETNLTSTSYPLAGLGYNTEYFVRVRAFNQAGAGVWSAVVQFTTESDSTAPEKGNGALIANGNFESALTGWGFYTNGTGTLASCTEAHEGTSAAKVSIVTAGSNMQLYHMGIALTASQKYRLSFAAKSKHGNDFSLSLMQDGEPYTNYGLSSRVVDVDTAWQVHTVEFEASGFSDSVTNGYLRIWFSGFAEAGDEYLIDNVTLTRVEGTSEQGTAVEAIAGEIPTRSKLNQNYPNPFNPETKIRFELARQEHVTLKVYDVKGAEVCVLVDGPQTAGVHEAVFNANALASGTYLCVMKSDSRAETMKMLLVR